MTTATCSRVHASELVTRTRAVAFEERPSVVHSGGREAYRAHRSLLAQSYEV